MKKLMINGLILMACIQGGNACATNSIEASHTAQAVELSMDLNRETPSVLLADFKHILDSDLLYASLLTLDTHVPDVTRNLKYVASYHQVLRTNEALEKLSVETEKNNRLMEQILRFLENDVPIHSM